jgi:hypothetical protein
MNGFWALTLPQHANITSAMLAALSLRFLEANLALHTGLIIQTSYSRVHRKTIYQNNSGDHREVPEGYRRND